MTQVAQNSSHPGSLKVEDLQFSFSEHRSVIDVLRGVSLEAKAERLPRLLVRLVVVRAPFFI